MKTTLCYICCYGQVLMLHRNRKENDISRGKWIGVGGKFLAGEGPRECLRREVREETGFEILEYRYRGIVDFLNDACEDEEMHLYTVSAFSFRGKDYGLPDSTLPEGGLPVPDCNEGTLAWIPCDQVLGLNLWEGDREFLPILLSSADERADMALAYHGDTLIERKPRA